MVMDGIVYGVGCMEFIMFFASDFYIAYTLNQLKQQHPAIDDCAPDDEAVVEMDAEPGVSNAHLASSAYSAASIVAAAVTATPMTSGSRLHSAVVMLSVAAPFFCFLQIISPDSMSWSLWSVPVWLSYVTIIPGLGLSIFYALRAARVSQIGDTVTKSSWLSVMWFRLDVVCAMATVMLLGWGDWLVAACLYAMDLYLAQRLLSTERRLVKATRSTQLLSDDLDSREEMSSRMHGATANTQPRGGMTGVLRAAASV